MNKEVIKYNVYGFRRKADNAQTELVVARSLALAVDIWLRSNDLVEPHDVVFLDTAFVEVDLPF